MWNANSLDQDIVSISYDDNRYTTNASLFIIYWLLF